MEKPEEILGEALHQNGLTLAVAESCTGGLVGDRVTNVPGSSAYYLGGITAYAYSAKEHLLGVSRETLERYGAVSDETVVEMAIGVRNAFGSDIAISVSGVAGPDGGTADKPVGLVYFGSVAANGKASSCHEIFSGTRTEIKQQAAKFALRLATDLAMNKGK